jgi:hypothetical protein
MGLLRLPSTLYPYPRTLAIEPNSRAHFLANSGIVDESSFATITTLNGIMETSIVSCQNLFANSKVTEPEVDIKDFSKEILTPKRSIRYRYSVATALLRMIISSPNTAYSLNQVKGTKPPTILWDTRHAAYWTIA